MPWGQVTGVRAIQWIQETLELLNAEKPGRLFTAEHMDKIGGESFQKVVRDLDTATAKEQRSRWRNEHIDAFCFQRDYRYGRRSRKWLFAKAEDTHLEGTSELWGTYVRVNRALKPHVDEIYKQDAKGLAMKSFQDLMKPEPIKTSKAPKL